MRGWEHRPLLTEGAGLVRCRGDMVSEPWVAALTTTLPPGQGHSGKRGPGPLPSQSFRHIKQQARPKQSFKMVLF